MKRLALAIVLCIFWGELNAAEQSAREPLDPLSSTGRLFSDPPIDRVKRAILVQEIARASHDEKNTIISFLRACIPNDELLHRNEYKSEQFFISCKQPVDLWRVRFGQYNPQRVIDNEISIFLEVLPWIKTSGKMFAIVDNLFDAQQNLALQENKSLDADAFIKHLELINSMEKILAYILNAFSGLLPA